MISGSLSRAFIQNQNAESDLDHEKRDFEVLGQCYRVLHSPRIEESKRKVGEQLGKFALCGDEEGAMERHSAYSLFSTKYSETYVRMSDDSFRALRRLALITLMLPSEINDDLLTSLQFFRDLTPQQLAEVRAVLKVKNLQLGDQLIGEDQIGDMVYVVAQGSVRICAHDEMGEAILAVRGPGEVVGEMSVLDGKARSASVITQEPSTVFAFTASDFWNVLWEMPPVPYNLACLLSQRVRVLSSQMRAMATLDVQGRLARQLMILGLEYGVPHAATGGTLIPFQLKQTELADMIGSTRVQVNRLLASWIRRGFISRDGSKIIIHQDASLENYYKKPVPKSQLPSAKKE